MQGGLVRRKLSVCLYACPYVKRVHCDKAEAKSVQIFRPHERMIIYPSAHFERIFARSASTVTPSEKNSINTNRKSNPLA